MSIDLRTDTITLPTEPMRRAMAEAVVGDDFYREDPTVAKLEGVAAERMGKEAGLFVPSGTMGNLLAHLTHCPGGAEVIGPENAHSFSSETGGPSRVAGMTLRTVPQPGPSLDVERYRAALRSRGLLSQGTGLLLVEQPTRGFVIDVSDLQSLRGIADDAGIPIHMDGARIFNAATSLGVSPREIAATADSVMFCLSKGLGAPIGSMLVGDAAFTERARLNRQMLGGGLRQAGILAAAGLFAMDHQVARLAEDHANAKRLASGLTADGRLTLDRTLVQSNIFFARMTDPSIAGRDLADALRRHGVLVNDPSAGKPAVRFVTHLGISASDIEVAINRVIAALDGLAAAGSVTGAGQGR